MQNIVLSENSSDIWNTSNFVSKIDDEKILSYHVIL